MLTASIVTTRLTLRALQPEHALLYQHYLLCNRLHLAPWEPLRSENYFDLAQCEERLHLQCLQAQSGHALYLSVFEQSEMIGTCNFSNIVRGVFQACHLGYAIAASHEGKGYMQEALQAGIQHMFAFEGLHRIMANYVAENQRSEKLLERLGFEREGYAKSYLKINGIWRDHVLTALINPDR